MWSPVSSADETVAPVIFIRTALLHFGCLLWGQMLCLAALPPGNSKRMDWKHVSFGEPRLGLFLLHPFFPNRSRNAEGTDCSLTIIAPCSSFRPTPQPLLPSSFSMPGCLTHVLTLRKENNIKSQRTNQPFHTAWKTPGIGKLQAFLFPNRTQTRRWGLSESEGSEDGKEIIKEERTCSVWAIHIIW